MKYKKIFLFIYCACSFNFLNAQQFYKQTAASQQWVDSVFNSLTPQQRIAQLMIVRESGITAGRVVFFNDRVEQLIRDYNIGSICLFQGGPIKQANNINHFQKVAQTPLMVCIDGETGLGMRMLDSVIKFPDQLTIGAVQDALGRRAIDERFEALDALREIHLGSTRHRGARTGLATLPRGPER